ncbi:MAG: DUF4388 domain-containing protein [Acidobacteriota bacterium]
MPAQGDFATVGAPSLIEELVRRRFSGTLRIEREALVKVLYFSQGDFACASSNAEEDRLGNLLVRNGRLSAEQLSHAKDKQSDKATIGNTLVELGFITSAELLWGARRQVEEIVGDLMGWRSGTYQVRDMPLSKEVVNLGLPSRSVLVRALQQLNDRELVVERLGSMESVLSRVEPFEESARAVDFGFPVETLLATLDGQRSVREICEASGLDGFQACKVLYTLLVLGIVTQAQRPLAKELIFVEGELQNGEQLPRADEETTGKARRGRRHSAAAPGPLPAAVTPDPATGPAVQAQDKDSPAAASAPEPAAPPAAPPGVIQTKVPARRRLSARTLAWGGGLAVVLLALIAGILYFAYFRPTLSADDLEEARLLAALAQELDSFEEEPAAGPPAPVPSPAGSAPEPAATANEAGEPAPGTAPPPGTSRRPSPAPPAGPAPRKEALALEKSPPFIMLSGDGNFRKGLNLVRDGQLSKAAESFRRALAAQQAGTHVIQLLLACQDSTVEQAFNRAPDRTLYFVTTTFRGQTCYRLFDGLYSSEAEARRQLQHVPSIFRQDGNQPLVVRAPGR